MSNQPPSGLPPPLIVSSRHLVRLEALLDSPDSVGKVLLLPTGA